MELTIGQTPIKATLDSHTTSITTANTNVTNLHSTLGTVSGTQNMGAVGQGGQTHYNMGANQTVTQLMRELETQVNTARTAAASATATQDGNSTLKAENPEFNGS